MSRFVTYILVMQCGIVNIGDEILAGKILNTNAFDLAGRLTSLGHDVAYALTLPDDIPVIASGLRDLLDHAGPRSAFPAVDLIILTGGLGPTLDDITREAVAAYLGCGLAYREEAAAWLSERLGMRSEELPAGQRRQVVLPEAAEPLRNPQGTACGLRFQAGTAQVLVFPGVPSELEAMARLHLEPMLAAGRLLLRRFIWTFGLSESKQGEFLADWSPPAPFRFSSLPNERGVVISLQAAVSESEADPLRSVLDKACAEVISRLPAEFVVDGESDRDLPQSVVHHLQAAGETLSLAESCTGGALGFLITEVPGSSKVFREGYLTYSNEAKSSLLGVTSGLLAEFGAVSAPVAKAMALGCQRRSGATWGLAITGIAGPDGGTPEKPVGTVFIGLAHREGGTAVKALNLKGTRNRIRWFSAYWALNVLRLAQKQIVILNT